MHARAHTTRSTPAPTGISARSTPAPTGDKRHCCGQVASHTLFTRQDVWWDPGQLARPLGRRKWGALVGGVEGASLVPLHVTDAAHGLHLGLGGPEVAAVLVITLLQQVLQPAVAGVLVADPPAGPEVGRGDVGRQEMQMEREGGNCLATRKGGASQSFHTNWVLSRYTPALPGTSLCYLPSLDGELTISRSNF